MLAIRLHRQGKINQPFFKIVVTEKQKSSTRGRFVEEVGFYNPLTKERKIEGERIKYWMSVGAKPTDTVHNMLVSEKIIDSPKIPKHKKAKKKDGETVAEGNGEAKPASAESSDEAKEETPNEEKPKETEQQTETQESQEKEEKEKIKQKAPETEEKK